MFIKFVDHNQFSCSWIKVHFLARSVTFGHERPVCSFGDCDMWLSLVMVVVVYCCDSSLVGDSWTVRPTLIGDTTLYTCPVYRVGLRWGGGVRSRLLKVRNTTFEYFNFFVFPNAYCIDRKDLRGSQFAYANLIYWEICSNSRYKLLIENSVRDSNFSALY